MTLFECNLCDFSFDPSQEIIDGWKFEPRCRLNWCPEWANWRDHAFSFSEIVSAAMDQMASKGYGYNAHYYDPEEGYFYNFFPLDNPLGVSPAGTVNLGPTPKDGDRNRAIALSILRVVERFPIEVEDG